MQNSRFAPSAHSARKPLRSKSAQRMKTASLEGKNNAFGFDNIFDFLFFLLERQILPLRFCQSNIINILF